MLMALLLFERHQYPLKCLGYWEKKNTLLIIVFPEFIFLSYFISFCFNAVLSMKLLIIILFFWCQVSHHPMIVACHCQGTGWKFWGDSNLKSKFWGRSIQLDPVGVLTLEFEDGEVFQWTKV